MQSAMFYVVLSCLMISATRDTITGLSHCSWLVVRSVGLAWFVRRVPDESASSGMGGPGVSDFGDGCAVFSVAVWVLLFVMVLHVARR